MSFVHAEPRIPTSHALPRLLGLHHHQHHDRAHTTQGCPLTTTLGLVVWILELGGWILELVVWILELVVWILELGVGILKRLES